MGHRRASAPSLLTYAGSIAEQPHLSLVPASLDDLDRVVALTTQRRRSLAAWSPQWWAPAEGADDLHPLWLRHLIEQQAGTVRVVEVVEAGVEPDARQVVGCMAVMPQAGQWFIDDLVVEDDSWWPAVVEAIVDQVPERPAVFAVPTADEPATDALVATGAVASGAMVSGVVSSYWVRTARTGAIAELGVFDVADGVVESLSRPVHTFGGAPFDPDAPSGFGFTVAAGSVVGLGAVAAPPVYDPGGPVTLVDLVAGDDLGALLDTTLAVAAERGDVLVAVVCDETNTALRGALAAADFVRTVDVYRLP